MNTDCIMSEITVYLKTLFVSQIEEFNMCKIGTKYKKCKKIDKMILLRSINKYSPSGEATASNH